MRIDAHQHFWRYQAAQYPWIQPEWPIRRDCLPPDLEPLLNESKIDASVAVQARQTLEESHWLLSLADHHPSIAGVVGWVDLLSPEVENQLAGLASHPKLVGVRHVVQDEPDDQFLARPAFLNGLAKLAPLNLTYDLLVFPRQLPAAIDATQKLPSQVFVLDHIAKPPIRDRVLSPWREQIQILAQSPNVFCKLSGLVTEAYWTAWKPEDFRPFLDVVFDAFGPNRLMFGSDWPVCLLAGTYPAVVDIIAKYVRQLSPADQDSIFGGNAARCYRIPQA